MMKTARFIFVLAFLSLVFCLFFTVPVSAQSENPTITPSPYIQTNHNAISNTNPDVPKNLHNWTQTVMIEVMSAMTCQLAGIDPVNPKAQCLGVDQKTGKIGYAEGGGGGAIGVAGHMI